MPIWQVILRGVQPSLNLKAGHVNRFNTILTLKVNKKGQTVEGLGLWRVSMWVSGNDNNSGDRIGYEEQVIIGSFCFFTSA